MTIKEFMNDVKETYKNYFPNSLCDIRIKYILGSVIFSDFYLAGNEKEVYNGYFENDMFKCSFAIHLSDSKGYSEDDEFETQTLESTSSCISIKSTDRWLAFDIKKIPFRKTTGDAKKILTAIDKYCAKLYSATNEAYETDNLCDKYEGLVEKKLKS